MGGGAGDNVKCGKGQEKGLREHGKEDLKGRKEERGNQEN